MADLRARCVNTRRYTAFGNRNRRAIERKPKGHDFDYSRQTISGQMSRHMSHTADKQNFVSFPAFVQIRLSFAQIAFLMMFFDVTRQQERCFTRSVRQEFVPFRMRSLTFTPLLMCFLSQ